MNTVILVVLNLITSWAVATQGGSIQFIKDSQVPVEIQAKIIEEIQQRCPSVFSATEVQTSVKIVQVDQGVQDTYFSTELSANTKGNKNSKIIQLRVQSVEWAVSHPDIEQFEVLWISSATESVCN
ncbi:MAG: hypothetical protein K2Q26_10550 [Bdellovibrionales bacterium]|nr:hypothetical protein [Bdellovibrionales bacterium]